MRLRRTQSRNLFQSIGAAARVRNSCSSLATNGQREQTITSINSLGNSGSSTLDIYLLRLTSYLYREAALLAPSYNTVIAVFLRLARSLTKGSNANTLCQ